MIKISRSVFKASKFLHKYLGLIFLLYFIMMGITGVLINHPELIRSISMPLSFVPPSYQYTNWNRMSIRETVFSDDLKDTHYVCGKEGVWQSRDRGKTYSPLKNGYPTHAGGRDTYCLLIAKKVNNSIIYAGTRDGLYYCNEGDYLWKKARFIDEKTESSEIVDIVNTSNQILAFTRTSCYMLDENSGTPVLRPFTLIIDVPPSSKAPLYKLLFHIHDGSLFGLTGKLFIDVIALVMIFLCIGAIYIWYMPWKKRHFKRKHFSKPMFVFFHRYHLKLGIYSAFFIIVLALTGIFIRPPLLITIIKYKVPSNWVNSHAPVNSLPVEIKKAIYRPEDNSIILAARGGKFFKGPADFSGVFTREPIKVPVSGMGVNSMEPLNNNRILIGSFTGFFIWDDLKKTATNINGKPVDTRKRSMTNMAGMSAGAAVKNGEMQFLADYRTGIIGIKGKTIPVMPPEVIEDGVMSLYSVLFEIHNGRFFRDLFGSYTWLIIPLGGLLLMFTIITGVYDWCYRKL